MWFPPIGGADVEQPVEHETSAALEKCNGDARERRRDFDFGLAFATAFSLRLPTAEVSDFESRSYDVWTDVSYGVARSPTLSAGAGVVARHRYLFEDALHAADAGLQLRFQVTNRFRLNGTAVWKPQDLSDLAGGSEALAVGGKADLRVYDDVWASLEVAYQRGDDAPSSGVLGLAGLRHSF